jgi:hypothetical protein
MATLIKSPFSQFVTTDTYLQDGENNRRNWQYYTKTIKIKEISPTRYALGK